MLGLTAPLLQGIPHVSHRFFGRTGGTSPHPWQGLNTSFTVGDSPARVEENLARVRFQVGVPRRALFTAEQVHGATALRVCAADEVDAVASSKADALFSTDEGIAVGVRTADCAPILLASRDGGCVAAVHAGWRGAVVGVISASVRALDEAGFGPERLVAAIGPCIGPEAFQVGPEVIEAAARIADLTGLVEDGAGDRKHLDLGGLVARLLEDAGVAAIERLGSCTASDLSGWFSYRAEGGRTGRQLAVIARSEPPRLDEWTFA